MILKSLLFGALGLASLTSQATAQYVNHLQKYYRFDPSVNPSKERRIFDTKALTRVNNGDERPKWTFVTTASGPANGNTASDLFMVITKLKANLPNSNAFNFERSNEYKLPAGGINADLNLKSVDVMDIVHAEGQGYIACGRVVTKEGKSNGFMLRINESLNPTNARLYTEVEVFNSCGFWHKENKGFVAVGASPTNDPKNVGRQAIFMSVKRNLNSVVCALNVTGTFPVSDEYMIDNQFNKVIKYSKKSTKLHAMVGTTKAYNNDDQRCTEDNDVLVMILNEKCKEIRVRQYGERTSSGEVGFDEEGFALTGFKEGAAQGLVITGKVRLSNQCQENVKYEDTLVFRLENNLSLNWFWRYDVYPPVSPRDTPDFGTAIVMNDQALPIYGSNAEEKNNILVAGETNTPFFSTQFDSTDQRLDTQDAFVLELNPSDGTVQKNEFFGLEDDAQNGVLRQGGLLDMHLTQDGHAVVMGNVRLFPVSDTSPINAKKPYLIERYDTISADPDLTGKCSLRKDIENQQIKLNINDVKTVLIEPEAIKFKLKKKKREWKEEVTCEKIDLPTSDAPTPKPTFGNIDDIIFEDDIMTDDIMTDDIILKPTPKPTFGNIGDDIFEDDIMTDDIMTDDIIPKPTPKPTFGIFLPDDIISFPDDIISFPDDKLEFEVELQGPGSF